MDPEDTARIDRRNTILAQIEAALLADKLTLEATPGQGNGTDPYNSGTCKRAPRPVAWKDKRPR